MFTIERTTSDNIDFKNLVKLLDKDLQIRDGDEHSFYAQFNTFDALKHVVVCFLEKEAIGCGAFRQYDPKKVEIKRMFVHPKYRGRAVGTTILNELEKWAAELNYIEALLETGKKQPEAISLYKKNGYEIITSYGQYLNLENSVCMMKKLQ